MPRDWRRTAVAEPPASTEGQRECARAEWCTGYRLVPADDGTSRRAPGLSYQAFCQPDTVLIAERLKELPEAFARLEADLGSPVRRNEMIRVPFGPAIPLSEYYDGLMRDIAPGLCSWAARVRALHRLTPIRPGSVLSPQTIKDAAGTLSKGQNLSALLALQPGWMTRTKPLKPGRRWWQPPDMTELLEEFGDCEIVRLGVDYVTLMIQLDGTHAGMEIFDWHRRCQLALGECAAKPEILDGIPCRVCGGFGLLRAELPSDPGTDPDWSRCPELSCGDRMDKPTYDAWVNRYKTWAEDAGPLTCQRCSRGDCDQCIYPGCDCAAISHAGQL